MSWADDQERLLGDALKAVKRNAYFMKKALVRCGLWSPPSASTRHFGLNLTG
jgi:hypothetical protein